MIRDEAMLPTNDYVFKRIFGKPGNEEITKGLISAIIKKDIKKLELDENPILEKDLKDDKVGILDIKARLDDNELCNIEMQVVRQSNIEKRMMFYWAKLYTSGIHEGENYNKLNKTIAILIANFELGNLRDILKFHTKWEVREEEYSKKILTDVFELHIIELPKLINQLNKNNISKNDKAVLWSLFIANPKGVGEKEMSENEDIKKANDEFEKINEDKHEQYLAHLRLKHIMDIKATEEYGYERGKEAGIAENQKEVILKLNKKNFSIKEISEIIDLSEEEIKTIIKEND